MTRPPCYNRAPWKGRWTPVFDYPPGRGWAVTPSGIKRRWSFWPHRTSQECMAWYKPVEGRQLPEPLREGWASGCVGCRWLPAYAKDLLPELTNQQA